MFVCLLFVCLNAFYAVQSAGSAGAAVGSAGTQGVHCGATSASGQRWPLRGLRRYRTVEARPPHRGIDDRERAKIQTWMPSDENIARLTSPW